jgi:epoxyqueuosine reductase
VDSAPVLEKAWAVNNGTGWLGKNGNLIRQGTGSFFFLCEMLLDAELEADGPVTDHCGSCTACMDACPTDAIFRPYEVDGSRCISYFTIELKDALIPESFQGKFDNWMFGCDTCQDVCPWNRFSKPHQIKELNPLPEILNLNLQDWESMSEEKFKEIFKNSPLKRAKFKGIQRNLRFLKK